MQITRFLHTAILVSDLAKAEEFYQNILGLPLAENRPFKFSGAWYQIGEYQIHLIVHPDFCNQVSNQEKWGRNPHLALATENLAAVKQRLENHGYPLQMSASGRAALFTQDPDSNVIEISQV
jgi:catechol 2,3-dioxygenase-like lactoylglutathione lyase family enzyme